MKKLRTITLLLIIMILINCTKEDNHTTTSANGVKIHNNTSTPTKPELNYKLTELFTISNDIAGIDSSAVIKVPYDIEVDSQKNLYILDAQSSTIKKFDSSGKFIKSFGRKGYGPGEFDIAIDLVMIQDTLCVQDIRSAQMVRFDLEGGFIDRIPYVGSPGILLEESIKSPSSDLVIGYKPQDIEKDGEIFYASYLLLMDSQFKEISILREFVYKFDATKTQFFEQLTKYAYGNEKIYVAENCDDKYRINVFDYNGKHIAIIKKNYAKVHYNDEESGIIDKLKLTAEDGSQLEQKRGYKKSINKLFYDKYGLLLVCSSIERNSSNDGQFIADVFKDGVFLNRIEIKELMQQDFNVSLNGIITYFFNDKIYVLNQSESSLTVYDYTVEGL